MKNFTKLAFVALLSVAMIGCGKTEEKNRMGQSDSFLRIASLPHGQGPAHQCGNGQCGRGAGRRPDGVYRSLSIAKQKLERSKRETDFTSQTGERSLR